MHDFKKSEVAEQCAICGKNFENPVHNPVRIRPGMEVQRAHDLIIGMLVGELGVRLTPEDSKLLRAQADVLCWALQHDHNESFKNNLKCIEDICKDSGFQIVGPTQAIH